MKRRSFLGFLGGAAVAGPSAAKQSLGDAQLKHMGFPHGTGALVSSKAETDSAAMALEVATSKPTMGRLKSFVAWIRKRGVPDFQMGEIQAVMQQMKSDGLDADLAVLVSMSPVNKARIQRARNYDRALDRMLMRVVSSKAREEFNAEVQKKFGFEPNWWY